jgi:cytochrome o ubiquinol oxidase subunit 2
MKSKSIMAKKTPSAKKITRIFIITILALVVFGLVMYWAMHGYDIAVLNPQGIIAEKERGLIIFTVLLGSVVVLPVFIMLFAFAWKYREGNTKAKYTPNDDKNKWIEGVWWGIPIAIIGVLSVVTWVSSHDIDPYKKIDSHVKPMTIRVVALQWKWLFLYPDQGVATVNEVRFPEKTPINFELTADAPMNAFWIPSLGSQIYAMSGMSSKLSLEAKNIGTFNGMSSNISGKGYSGMTFKAISESRNDFDTWAKNIAGSSTQLTWDSYNQLVEPSENNQVVYYMLREPDLYNRVIMKYMNSSGSPDDMNMEMPERMTH